MIDFIVPSMQQMRENEIELFEFIRNKKEEKIKSCIAPYEVKKCQVEDQHPMTQNIAKK